MKHHYSTLGLLIAACGVVTTLTAKPPRLGQGVDTAAMRQCAAWEAEHFDGAASQLPFHFMYNGTSSDTLLLNQRPSIKQRTEGSRIIQSRIYTIDNTLEVRCEMVHYTDYPAVEWTLYLKNRGSQPTGIIERIQTLQTPFSLTKTAAPLLHYYEGGNSGRSDYSPQQLALTTGQRKEVGAFWGGFPTAENLPFFNLEWNDHSGILLGLGWPARWRTEFKHTSDSLLTIEAGQIHTHLYLEAGEEIRTPLVVMMFWQGTRDGSHNMWLHWMCDHNLPRVKGELPGKMLEAASSAYFAEMTNATTKDQIEFIDRYLEEEIKLDYWWMDAGWYPNKGGSWQDLLGTWYPDPKRYPNGLREISDHAHAKGVKSLLWFEPERVTEGSWIYQYHPEWTLGTGGTRFFNYGNPTARAWMTNHLDSLLKSERIDLYRQDFAVFSSGYWDAEDNAHPDRQGIAEIKHVIGYLQNLDELRDRHPQMWIDICAAGGKRLELENLRRAIPLWRSDYAFEPCGVQNQTYGLSLWIPYSGAGVNSITRYDFRSNMSPSIVLNLDSRVRTADWALLRRLLDQWNEIYDDYRGDFYPLTHFSVQNDVWMAWEFYRPAQGTGFVQVFNRAESPYSAGTLKFKGLDAAKSYRITDLDSRQCTTFSGDHLMNSGLAIHFKKAPDDQLIRIEEIR